MHHDPADSQTLTIGDLADRTGLSAALLRMWEARHGFPEPMRLGSGHRRYSEADVGLVQQVLRRKGSGTRLEVAIAEALGSKPPAAPSVFAELRRLHPTLAVNRLRKSTLIALSHAIEDECCANASDPVLFGAFQRDDFYAPSAARWAELTRVARTAVVFADDWAGATDGPLRATLGEKAPMRREWAIVCDAVNSPACLSAWELPGQNDLADRDRVFEAVWTVDPVAVRDAARAAATVALDAGIFQAQQVLLDLAEPAVPETSSQGALALMNRVLAYVDRMG